MRAIGLAVVVVGVVAFSGAASADQVSTRGIGTFQVTSVTADDAVALVDTGSEIWFDVRADGRWVMARKVGDKVSVVGGRWTTTDGIRQLHLDNDDGPVVLAMNINQTRGPMNFNSKLAGAVRGGAMAATRTKKKTFAQKLGGFAKGVANVGLNVAGAVIPGGGILKNAIGGAMATLRSS
jgi:hypothetical protein